MVDEVQRHDLIEATRAIASLPVDESAKRYLLAQLYHDKELWYETLSQLERLGPRVRIYIILPLSAARRYVRRVRQIGDARQAYRSALKAARAVRDKGARLTPAMAWPTLPIYWARPERRKGSSARHKRSISR